MNATAGTNMCHGNFTYWCSFTAPDGKYVHLNKYLRKGDLWMDAKLQGATPVQVKQMKEQMGKAPTKKMYWR